MTWRSDAFRCIIVAICIAFLILIGIKIAVDANIHIQVPFVWVHLVLITSIIFGNIMYWYRALFHDAKFWGIVVVMFMVHCIVFGYVFLRTGPWAFPAEPIWGAVDGIIVMGIISWVFHVSPQQ